MKTAVERFCSAIDKAFEGRPEKKEQAARIFAKVFERMFHVTLMDHGGMPPKKGERVYHARDSRHP